jgi:hypothetical protein
VSVGTVPRGICARRALGKESRRASDALDLSEAFAHASRPLLNAVALCRDLRRRSNRTDAR